MMTIQAAAMTSASVVRPRPPGPTSQIGRLTLSSLKSFWLSENVQLIDNSITSSIRTERNWQESVITSTAI